MLSKKFIAATEQYSMGENGEAHIIGAPMFRREFFYEGECDCVLTICGLGFYELYINGLNITKGKLAPYISNPDVCYYYDSYEIRKHLVKGKNVIGVILGNGFLNPQVKCWDFEKVPFRSAPKFAISLTMNEQTVLEADEEFLWNYSPITYDDLRYGEHYDARLEILDWCNPEYNAKNWKRPVLADMPKGKARLCEAEPIRCVRQVKSTRHWKIEQGFVYDFGENVAGVCTLNIQGWEGQTIRFQHGETLLEDRSLYIKNITAPEIKNKWDWQTDVYICKGKGNTETYTPHFTYHGFRYVFVEGITDEQATDDLFTMEVWHSNFEDISELITDNPVVNKLQEMTLRSDLSNFLYVVTDCPQREKNGWTGDAALSAEQMLYNFSCENSLREWIRNLAKSQRSDGCIPTLCPTGDWGYELYNGPGASSALIEVVYQIYRFGGDKGVIEENLDAIIKMVDFVLSKRNTAGMLAYGLPDWCETLSLGEHMSSTPLEVTDTLFCVNMLQKAAFLADVVEKKEISVYFKQEALQLISLFRKKYLTEDLYISCKTQAAQALSLSAGVFTEDENEKAFQNLMVLIREKGYFKVGANGARVLFRVLCDHGEHELAYRLMTQNDLPSFRWWINQGMTTLGESINETYPGSSLRKDGSRMLSLNHHFWGDISAWFYRYILGININPNMDDANHIELAPLSFQNINYARGVYTRNGNRLVVEMKKTSDGVATATVIENSGFSISVK